ncbi:MAG: ABC transporter permease [Proteobacteria bacterium]|nr:ABC transporter permease [Pseudomonadota bacterium]
MNGVVAGRDLRVLLLVPAVLAVLMLFIYPFAYGVLLSIRPAEGAWTANYVRFFSEPRLYQTIGTTLLISLPVTIFNLLIALPMAYLLRVPSRTQRLIAAALVIPMTLGTVLVAQGMLTYLSPNGWFNRTLLHLGFISQPLQLLHGPLAVILSLVITGFPFAFLMLLSYVTGIDPSLGRAASTLGASPAAQFKRVYLPLLVPGLVTTFCLVFVQAFAVFPSAVLLGSPAGSTRVISLAAYEAAYEDFNYSMASSIALVMGAVQLVIVLFALGIRRAAYRGPASGGKG